MKLVILCCQEKPLAMLWCGPYPKPTQVVRYKCTEALERTMVKELGKMPP